MWRSRVRRSNPRACRPDHPLRHAWRQYFEPHGVRFIREQSIVFNAGFVGDRGNTVTSSRHGSACCC